METNVSPFHCRMAIRCRCGTDGRSKENVNFEEAKKEDHTGRGCIGGGNEAVDILGKDIEVNKEGTLFQANTGSRRLDSQRSGERVE